MTATGLIVTDLSHPRVGLNDRGDFRRPLRFAVSSKPSRPARRQSVPPQVMRPYNHPSRLCAASSRASHNSMPGLQPARSRWASAAIWSAVSASAASRHASSLYKGHRYPDEIIAHCVWLYHRFPLSFREVEELMFQRGVVVSYETIRAWCAKFGQAYANQLRRRAPPPRR